MISDKLLNIAMNEALKSKMFHRHGAILFKGRKVIAKGHNYVERSWIKGGIMVPSTHAEMDCSRRVLWPSKVG